MIARRRVEEEEGRSRTSSERESIIAAGGLVGFCQTKYRSPRRHRSQIYVGLHVSHIHLYFKRLFRPL